MNEGKKEEKKKAILTKMCVRNGRKQWTKNK